MGLVYGATLHLPHLLMNITSRSLALLLLLFLLPRTGHALDIDLDKDGLNDVWQRHYPKNVNGHSGTCGFGRRFRGRSTNPIWARI